MIKPEAAYKILKNKYKNLNVKQIYDLPPKYYLFLALEKGLKRDVNDPFYAIDKNDGTVYNYVPSTDLDNFSKKREITIKELT